MIHPEDGSPTSPPSLGLKPANPLIEAALKYSQENKWRIFPVRGKKPLLATRGFLDATVDPDVINSWIPGAFDGIALATGTGLVVLDVDLPNGPDSLAELESKYGHVPDTLMALTPSGGSHHYFVFGGEFRNSTSKLGAGLDIRGDGGYVVLPPSPGYAWDLGYDGPIAELPVWLSRMLLQPIHTVQPIRGSGWTSGGRNAGLASMAGTLRRRPEINFEGFKAALEAINATECRPPLENREVEQIARSIWKYDTNSPRRGESGHLDRAGDGRQGPNGSGFPQGRPFRGPRKPRGFFDGAGYLGRGR